jgi:hypothetical protein
VQCGAPVRPIRFATWCRDTYYFTLNRFYDTLDWHAAKIPAEKLGIGMMNRADINTEGWLARFHALHTKLVSRQQTAESRQQRVESRIEQNRAESRA